MAKWKRKTEKEGRRVRRKVKKKKKKRRKQGKEEEGLNHEVGKFLKTGKKGTGKNETEEESEGEGNESLNNDRVGEIKDGCCDLWEE